MQERIRLMVYCFLHQRCQPESSARCAGYTSCKHRHRNHSRCLHHVLMLDQVLDVKRTMVAWRFVAPDGGKLLVHVSKCTLKCDQDGMVFAYSVSTMRGAPCRDDWLFNQNALSGLALQHATVHAPERVFASQLPGCSHKVCSLGIEERSESCP
jgi:hypothetical protein